MDNNELLEQIGALVNATSIQAVIGQLGAWLDNYAAVVEKIDGAASGAKCLAYREVAGRLADLAALPDGERPGTMSGQAIYVSEDGSTLFIPLPRDLALNIDGGCDCEYCKAHPDVTPKWDALALAAKPKNRHGDHTWTVHFPNLNKAGLKLYGWKGSNQ